MVVAVAVWTATCCGLWVRIEAVAVDFVQDVLKACGWVLESSWVDGASVRDGTCQRTILGEVWAGH